MEAVPWTVAAFKQRRRGTWRATRMWLLLLFVGVGGFSVPFYLESKKVTVQNTGSHVKFYLSLDDMTGSELAISLVSLVVVGIGGVAVVMAIQRHYLCPKCEEVPIKLGNGFGPNLFSGQSSFNLYPSICPMCGARLK